MKRIIILGLLLCSAIVQADITEIKNSTMQRLGVCSDSIAAWLQPQARVQDYDGQYYAAFLNKKIFEKKGCFRIRKVNYHTSKPPIYIVAVKLSCLNESLRIEHESYVPKLIIKTLVQQTYRNTDYQNEKPNIDEINRIERAETILQGKKFPKFFPRLGTLVGNYKVDCRDMRTYYFSIYHMAKGTPLRTLMETKPVSETTAIFAELGKKLGHFHFAHMEHGTHYAGELLSPHLSLGILQRSAYYKTRIHGDLHLTNILYDEGKNLITFIDTESMGYSVDQKHSILRDIEAVVMRYFLYEKGFQQNIIGIEEVFGLCMTSFLRAYVSAYPQNMHENLKRYLCNILEYHHVTSHISPPFKYILPELDDFQTAVFDDMMRNIKENLSDS